MLSPTKAIKVWHLITKLESRSAFFASVPGHCMRVKSNWVDCQTYSSKVHSWRTLSQTPTTKWSTSTNWRWHPSSSKRASARIRGCISTARQCTSYRRVRLTAISAACTSSSRWVRDKASTPPDLFANSSPMCSDHFRSLSAATASMDISNAKSVEW